MCQFQFDITKNYIGFHLSGVFIHSYAKVKLWSTPVTQEHPEAGVEMLRTWTRSGTGETTAWCMLDA